TSAEAPAYEAESFDDADVSGEYEAGHADEYGDDDHESSAVAPPPNPELERVIQMAALDGGKSLKNDPDLKEIRKKTSMATKVGLTIFAGALLIVGGWAAYTQKRASDEQALFDQIAAMSDRDAQLKALTEALPDMTNEDLKVRILRNLGHFRHAPAVPVITEQLGYGGLIRRHAAAAP